MRNRKETHTHKLSPLHHVFHILKHTTPHTWHTPPHRKRQREQEEGEATKTKKEKEWKQQWEVWSGGEWGWREGSGGGGEGSEKKWKLVKEGGRKRRREKEVSKMHEVWAVILFITMLRCRRGDWEGRGG